MKGWLVLRLAIIAGDVALLNLAFLLAYWMRYSLGMGGEVSEQFQVDLGAYAYIQAAFAAIWVGVFALGGLYRRPAHTPFLDQAAVILGGSGFAMMLTLAVVFVFRGYAYSRWLFFFAWMVAVILLCAQRGAMRLIIAYLQSRGIGVQRALVVGGDPLGMLVMHIIATEPGLNYQLVGFVQENDTGDVGRFRCLGQLQHLERVVQEHRIDEVIIALPSTAHHNIPQITAHCQSQNISFKIVPDLYELSLNRMDVQELRGLPLISIMEPSIRGPALVLKRTFDIAVSVLILVLGAPLWGLMALLIKLDSPGPVLFSQQRVGKDGKVFEAHKFRSMREGAETALETLSSNNEATGPLFKMRDDPRITRMGKWLRRTSLDEIPQLLNVLAGDMSVVGPRPPLPAEVAQYEPWHHRRLEVAPGLTGLWQVSGRSDVPFDEMVMLDIYYIQNWSLALDLKTLLRTIPAVLSGRGAY